MRGSWGVTVGGPRVSVACAVAVCAALLAGTRLAAEPKTSPAFPAPASLILDDAPEPLTTQRPRTDAQRDRLEAVTLFATGRTHEQRGEYADALRCYQRVLRFDPQAGTVLGAVHRLAMRLNRPAVALRYAARATELDGADPLLLRRLGDLATKEGDWAGALALYEKAMAARGAAKETADDILLRMQMGLLYHLTEQFKPAADSFARVLYALNHPAEFGLGEHHKKLLLGKAGATYQLMGDSLLLADRPQEAMAAFQLADQVAPDKALRQFNLARVCVKTGKASESLTAIEAALAEHLGGEGIAPYETLAEILSSLGKKDELLGRLEKLRAAEPDNLPLGYYLATQYQAVEKLDKAESLYLQLLKEKPTLAAYRSLVDIYRQSKQFDALLAILGEALEKTSVLEILGAEAQTVSGDADTMRGVVDTARSKMKSEPEKFGYGMRLAVALLALEAKQYETAGQFFNLAVAAKPKQAGEVLMLWGLGLLTGERAAEAAKVFQRGIDEKAMPDDNPAFHFYLAGALAMAQRTDDALAAARTAAEKKKDSARFRSRAAWVLYFAKRNDEATKEYSDLIRDFDADHASTETREVLREARLALSNLAVIKGDVLQAEEWLEQVLDEFPDDEGALNDLGYLWADHNEHLDRAKRMIEKAVAAEPDNMAYRDSLGWVLFRLGKYPEAVVELEKAAAGKKPDGVVLDHLGDAYQQSNRHDKAVETWGKAVEVLRQEKETEKAETVQKKIIAK